MDNISSMVVSTSGQRPVFRGGLTPSLSFTQLYLHTSGEPGSPWSFLGVSQNINVLYLNACPIGSVIEIETYSAQVGRSIALLITDIWLVKRDDDTEDTGEGSVHDGKWKRIKKTINGSHTKVRACFLTLSARSSILMLTSLLVGRQFCSCKALASQLESLELCCGLLPHTDTRSRLKGGV